MKKLTIREYAYLAVEEPGIGEKNTVSNGPDNGALNCLAAHFWSAMRHGSTQQAIDNGLSRVLIKIDPTPPGALISEGALGAGPLNIAGHANEGCFETGMGQTGPFNPNQWVATWNESNWGPQLDRIKPSSVTVISIWGCHPGAGQEGADLLFAMARRSGRAVRGGTGFLYCSDHIYWENGSVWQVATPTTKPVPIQAPSQHGIFLEKMNFEHEGKELDAADVVAIEVSLQALGQGRISSKTLNGQAAKDVVIHLFKSPPMDMTNVFVPAVVTAKVRISFSSNNAIEFVVYNDRLAVDEKSRTGYYVASIRSLALAPG